MKPLTILKLMLPLLGIFTGCDAQIKHLKTVTMNISGNCDMCKDVIEKAGTKKNLSEINWNADTKKAIIRYDSTRTNSDKILKEIALAGYDNEKYLAPDESYSNLPSCCHYTRKTGSGLKLIPVVSAGDGLPSDTGQIKFTAVNPINSLLDRYMDLKDALVKSDAAGVSAKAKTFVIELQKIIDNGLSENQKAAYSSYSKGIASALIEISNSKNLETQRERFATLSAQMYELAKSQNSKGFYYQHCPMYNNGKNSNWLSYDKTIKNPFYGMEMLGCGKTIESVNIK